MPYRGLYHSPSQLRKMLPNREKRRSKPHITFQQAIINSATVVLDVVDADEQERLAKGGLAKAFLTQASFHGNVLKHAKGKGKVFWGIILTMATIGLGIAVTKVTLRYINAPTATEVHVEAVKGIKFPAIVICSLNPFNRTYLLERNISLKTSLYAQHVYITTKNDASPRLHISEETEEEQKLLNMTDVHYGGDLRGFFMKGGYRCEEFLRACAFEWKQFNCCDIAQPVFDIHFGKCFLLGENRVQKYPAAGLQVKLQVHRELYVPKLASPSVGVALRILQEYDPSATEYTFLSPGKHVAMQLEETMHQYLNTLIRTICRQQEVNWTQHSTAPYTQNQCIALCFNEAALRHCNCSYPQDVRLFGTRLPPRICTPMETVICLLPKVEADQEVHECAQSCLPECTQLQYRSTVSTADLPNAKDTHFASGMAEPDFSDFVLLDVFFSKIQRTHVEEVFIVTADNLISQIGGLMGIFLGASLITAIQLVMFAVSLCYNKICKRRPREVDEESSDQVITNSQYGSAQDGHVTIPMTNHHR